MQQHIDPNVKGTLCEVYSYQSMSAKGHRTGSTIFFLKMGNALSLEWKMWWWWW